MVERFGDDSRKSEKTEIGSVADFGVSLFDSAIARPYNATIGLIAPKIDLSKEYNHNSYAAKIGDFGGTAVDIAIISKFAGAGVSKALGAGAERGLISASLAESKLLASTLTFSSTGALYGGVFTPGSFQERLKNATVDAATFGAMGAASTQFSKFGFLGTPGNRTLLQEMGLGAMSGAPGGIVNAEMTSLVNGRGLTFDAGTLGKSALYYGAFGAAMGGVTHGVAKGSEMTRSWWKESSANTKTQASQTEVAPAEPVSADAVKRAGGANSEPADAVKRAGGANSEPTKFNIPETGNVELGRMMRDLPAADQIRLVQEVIKSRPNVPVGSWMRLISAEEMPNFLRATEQMYPGTSLSTANYLVESRNLRPPTPDSPPVDFAGWQRAIETVKAEQAAAPEAALRSALSAPAETVKPVGAPIDALKSVDATITAQVSDTAFGGTTLGLTAFSAQHSSESATSNLTARSRVKSAPGYPEITQVEPLPPKVADLPQKVAQPQQVEQLPPQPLSDIPSVAWKESLGAKLRRVSPTTPESDWLIKKKN